MVRLTVVLNHNHGPWLSGNFLTQKSEAARLFCQVGLPEDVLPFMEDILEEQGLGLEGPEDALDMSKKLFERILGQSTFCCPGPLVPQR